ncbi:C-GCAxxG-C-C family protein [Desulfovibrio mangrovi]|nr:C-GCAxxG-C-C family protein [Desulfovibrio mangrovi]UZP66217.1 C-GCAxxG-C-C family protein [Desulfovibrio mangrovi]
MSSLIKSIRNDSRIAACGDAAAAHFSGLYCAESVLLAVAEAEGLATDFIPRIASGFCSGFSRSGGLCGAVAGGVMAISLVHGRDGADDPVLPAYARVTALRKAIAAKWGNINCHPLSLCDFNTPEGQHRFRNEGVRDSICLELTRDCASLALWLIRNNLDTISALADTQCELLS